MSKNELEHLNQVARIYGNEAGALNRDIASYYSLKCTLRHVSGGRILQLGLGDGLIASALAAISSASLDVIEGASAVIAQVPSDGTYQVIHTLFEDYRPGGLYDYVVGNHVLEHVADPVAIVSLVKNWLRPGGLAIFTVPNANSLHRRIGVAMGLLKHVQELNAQDLELGHRRVYTIPEIRDDLSRAGFTDVTIKGYMLKMVSHAQMKGWSRSLLDAIYDVSIEADPNICSNILALCKR
ncbi:MAG: methyltransferase domain-containing protein [Opitutaceae bacterium]|nr:methyltransferase domain-containing protein [Opitutaceae bacterium]